jgi:glycine/D-amino acid oxidase-like deaminating enzyme
MKLVPYWWDDAPLVASSAIELPARADTAIIGAGYTGLSAALTLLRAGRSVVMIEAGLAAQGASSRNGGMCGDLLKPSLGQLAARYGKQSAIALYSEARDALVFLQDFIADNKIECDFVRVGRLTGALSQQQLKALESEAQILRKEVGTDYQIVSGPGIRDEIGSDLYVGARVFPHHGGLHPAKYAAALVRLVRERGGAIHDSTRLLHYERTAQGFLLTTSRGNLRARELIIATNGYTTAVTSWLRRRIIPVTSYMIATEEIPDATMKQLFPTGRMVTDTNRLLCYYRPSPDRKRILFGGRPAYTEIKPEQSAERLMRYLRRIFPELNATSATHSWFGYIGYTFDHLPHLGKRDGAYYAAGYCGSGVVMATWLGQKAAYRLLGKPEGRSAFADIPHPAHVLYYGRPWFLPLVQAWYQLRDTSAR